MNRQPSRTFSEKFSAERLSRSIVRFRFALMGLGLVIGMIAYPLSTRVSFNRSIEAMFADDDPSLLAYRELQQSFGGNSVVMLVYEDADIASDQGLQRNAAISERVEKISGVSGVLSPAVLNRAVEKIRPGSLFSKDAALLRKGDAVASGFMDMFSGYTHSADRRYAAVVAMLDPDHGRDTIESLQSLASGLSDRHHDAIGEVSLVGEPVLVHDGFDLIERDGSRLAITTTALLSIVLVVALLDLRLVALAVAMIGWSIVVTKSSMLLLNIELSLVSTILTAIVTVIAVTAVLHLGIRYQGSLRRDRTRARAASGAIAWLAGPIFWTCMTDAAGFAALWASRILPVRQFGIMIAIASLAVFVSLILFAPLLMTVPGWSTSAATRPARLIGRVNRGLRRVGLRAASWSVSHRATCFGISWISVAIIVVGLGRTEVETSFLNNFQSDSEIVQDYANVEANFGGAGVWDVVLDAPDELSEEYLASVRELENELRRIDIGGAKLTKVISLADADLVAQRVRLLRLVSPSTRLSGMQATMPVFFAALLGRSEAPMQTKFRIMLRSEEHLDATSKTALIDRVRQVVSDSDVGKSGRVTGYYVMMARLVSQMVGDQWRCFAASGAMVWLLLIAATRSFRLATSAVVPNLLPVFLVLAMVGLMGGKINMGAAMIAAVSIGLSIDGSVHLLAAYRRLRRRGHDSRSAAVHAAGNIGAPVFLATVALVIGFGAMMTSEFVPTATFGTLVAVTLVLGTAVNLTLLPAIVSWVD